LKGATNKDIAGRNDQTIEKNFKSKFKTATKINLKPRAKAV
jgi:hypothetical protein